MNRYLLVLAYFLLYNTGFGQNYKNNKDTILSDYSGRKLNGIELRSKTIISLAEFHGTQFDSTANFRGAKFDSLANFRFADFYTHASFNSTKFQKSAIFNYANFHLTADFEEAIFDSLADFSRSQFNSTANFKNAKFNKITFYDVYLPELLIFEGVSTNEIIDLTTINPPNLKRIITASTEEDIKTDGPKKCEINLIDAPIEKFKLRYDEFYVYIPKYRSRLEAQKGYEKLTNVYEGLLKNFKDHGYLRSYGKLDREYQKFKFTQNPFRSDYGRAAGSVLNWVNKNWNNYGYDKSRIWYITLNFFIIFAFINWLRFPQLLISVYQVPSLKKVFNKNKKLRDFKERRGRYPHLNFRTPLLALYYTAIIFFGLKLSIENMRFEKPLSVSLIFLQYTIGLICVAYLANFVISSTLIGS